MISIGRISFIKSEAYSPNVFNSKITHNPFHLNRTPFFSLPSSYIMYLHFLYLPSPQHNNFLFPLMENAQPITVYPNVTNFRNKSGHLFVRRCKCHACVQVETRMQSKFRRIVFLELIKLKEIRNLNFLKFHGCSFNTTDFWKEAGGYLGPTPIIHFVNLLCESEW